MSLYENQYFEWLISQIQYPKSKTFNELFQKMHHIEFVWVVPNDDNRVQDGLDLRIEFYDGNRPAKESSIISVLELVIAISRRIAFVAEGDPSVWAWQLIKNLRLNRMSDPLTDYENEKTDEVLNNLVWRQYYPDGRGGFFPLANPNEDQRKVELWEQMHAYVNEMLTV